MKTYFIQGRKSDTSYENFLHRNDNPPPSLLPILVAPPSSPPKSQSHTVSCDSKQPYYLADASSDSLGCATNRIKAYSLPSILNSDNNNEDSEGGEDGRDISKSPTSLTSCGASTKFSPLSVSSWKHQPKKFKRRSGEEIS
jgi:hypothetical protein